jgi:hypothetical protein
VTDSPHAVWEVLHRRWLPGTRRAFACRPTWVQASSTEPGYLLDNDAIAQCPAGKIVVTGAYVAFGATVISEGPTSPIPSIGTPTGWDVQAEHTPGIFDWTVTAYALCANP